MIRKKGRVAFFSKKKKECLAHERTSIFLSWVHQSCCIWCSLCKSSHICFSVDFHLFLTVVMFITGPLTGVLSDRLVSRHGRRRPIMFAGSIVLL